jgi:predicted transposase YbfD/YdcC
VPPPSSTCSGGWIGPRSKHVWAAQVLATLPAATPPCPALAIEGKALRGSRKQGAPLTHLLSAVSHRLGLTLGQLAVDDKTNEITAIHTLLQGLLLDGWVVTVDALLTQQKIAQAIVAAGGGYIMIVKENQPTLRDDIATGFADPALLAGTSTTATTQNRGHGRAERRTLTLTSALADYLTWPGQQQVFQVVRTRTDQQAGEVSRETEYGSTSLPRARADAAFVLARVRNHWQIENTLHYVKDVVLGEDRSLIHCGQGPTILALLREAALNLLRRTGVRQISARLRYHSQHPCAGYKKHPSGSTAPGAPYAARR